MNLVCVVSVMVSTAAVAAVPFKNGTAFALKDVPGELVVERRAGEPVRFVLEENGTTGYQWTAEWNTNECEVVIEHRGAVARNERGEMLCGAAGALNVSVTSRIYTPARIEFAYKRSWEKGVKPIRALKLIVYTVGEPKSPPYPRPQFLKLAKEMGAKFSFGTNNFDPSPKDLSRWLEAIVWLDLRPADIWTPGSKR